MAKLKITNKVRRTVPASDDVGPNVVPPSIQETAIEGKGISEPYHRVDGRSMRRTGRTVPFGTRVTAAYDTRLREVSQLDDKTFAEIMEDGLLLYDRLRELAQREGKTLVEIMEQLLLLYDQ